MKVPRAGAVKAEVEDWVGYGHTRYVNELESGSYGVWTWAMFQDGGQVGLIRLRVGESVMYSGAGKELVECL